MILTLAAKRVSGGNSRCGGASRDGRRVRCAEDDFAPLNLEFAFGIWNLRSEIVL